MSYTQRYRDSITVSGSRTVSYPRSNSGGSQTVHYTETVPLDITVNVLTEPFDSSVASANRSIDVLTGAVAAMNASQCAAITQTGKEVSAHIIDGFFGSIKIELSQQIQALDSAIKAGFGLIAEQGKAVSAQKDIMEADYNRISSRYATLFQDLDDECYKRIVALDKQSFSLSEKVQRTLLSETTGNEAAKSLLTILDESSSKVMLAISGMNRKARDILKTLHDYITQENQIAGLIDSFMFDEPVENKTDLFVPVIFSESADITSSNKIQRCALPNFISDSGKNIISDAIINFGTNSPKDTWVNMHEDDRALIGRELNSLCESHFTDRDEVQNRIYKTMIELWQKSNLKSTKG